MGQFLPLKDSEGAIIGINVVVEEITERKRAEEALRAAVADLASSNKELAQFASVVSHDLQEPLRMVIAFSGRLKEAYQGKLDATADEYIGFAVEGATRMQALVGALLSYSRIGAKPKDRAPTRVQEALEAARVNLKAAIEESGAVISQEELPTVMADGLQLTQVFQNLIGNAIKYRAPGVTPDIHIGARRVADLAPDLWLLSVRDNGIGIDPQYKDRIFEIFQRLHTREEYEGTGVGLAICKKIVEGHGGRIWVESQPGQGSTFFFTMPA
jgi:light-regulated signal transduction histidine kinase (bacteriophytochrome)